MLFSYSQLNLLNRFIGHRPIVCLDGIIETSPRVLVDLSILHYATGFLGLILIRIVTYIMCLICLSRTLSFLVVYLHTHSLYTQFISVVVPVVIPTLYC